MTDSITIKNNALKSTWIEDAFNSLKHLKSESVVTSEYSFDQGEYLFYRDGKPLKEGVDYILDSNGYVQFLEKQPENEDWIAETFV